MADESQRAEARIGRVLNDKWRLDRLLGIGGMAAVYAATHRNEMRAAVKVLHPELAQQPDVRARFLHEGKAANRVSHPNAVQVLDDDVVRGGEDDGAAYLVMELLEGESLLDRARRQGGPLPEDEVLVIAEGVLDVLDAAHRNGIIHRDLKPENLFLVRVPEGESPRVKVLDFGIARIADGGGRTRVGTALGTPTYMAPEQARGKRDEIDGRTDLFALGATMFRLLSGSRIHEAPSPAEILAKMATVPAPALRSVAAFVSERTAAIVDRAVRFRREDRYESAAAMRLDVRAAIANEPLPSASASVGPSPGPALQGDATVVERAIAAAPAGSFGASTLDPTKAPPVVLTAPQEATVVAAAPAAIPLDAATAAAPPALAPAAPVAIPTTAQVLAYVPPAIATPQPVAPAQPASAAAAPRSRRPLVAILVACGVLLGAIGVVLGFTLGSSSDPPIVEQHRAREDEDEDPPAATKEVASVSAVAASSSVGADAGSPHPTGKPPKLPPPRPHTATPQATAKLPPTAIPPNVPTSNVPPNVAQPTVVPPAPKSKNKGGPNDVIQ